MDIVQLLSQQKTLDLVIDSDTGNETDDQFAVAYALMRPDRFRVHALTAAPFLHYRVLTAAEGEFCSHLEQRRLLHYFPNCKTALWWGSPCFLAEANAKTDAPLPEGVTRLLEISKKFSRRKPLFYVGLATLTDLAIALLADPTLAERVVLVWLGGQEYHRSPEEFNLLQDAAAAQIVLNSSFRQIIFPCTGVADTLRLTQQEARQLSAHRGVGDFLLHRFTRHLTWSYGENPAPTVSLPLYDLTPLAYLARPARVKMALCRRLMLETNPLRRGDPLPYDDLVAASLDREGIIEDFSQALQNQPEIPLPHF